MAGVNGSTVKFIRSASKKLHLNNYSDREKVFKNLKIITQLSFRCLKNFAVVILNVQSIVDLEKTVIGGGISIQPKLMKEINHQYYALRKSFPLMNSSLEPIEIVPCQFHGEANYNLYYCK
ncbi:hypothetical protein [Virgibacillus pantothenticus]|uniref:hypothetical protein n=1 Tax=Virgibacillus pantothenticus TaxID=1473 RepID=UPI0025AEDEAE|nr:hypothetical protein [Virgibacillus pantothenticus]